MRRIWILVVGLIVQYTAFSQEWQVENTLEDLLESVAESFEEGFGYQEVLEDMEYYYQYKLPLNLASKEELLKLHLLNEDQIDKLLLYKHESGNILSIYELSSIEGFDQELVRKIAPFVSLETEEEMFIQSKKTTNDLFLRRIESFTDDQSLENNYEGSTERLYLKFRHNSERHCYGIIAEKDPGEAFLRGSNKYGFDYYSAFYNLRIKKHQIYVGDYSIQFGQGLNAWQGFAAGKSSETTNVLKTNQGIRSYSSTDENLFFRGIAADFQLGAFSFHPFLSSHKVDASLDSLNGEPVFSSFQSSGYHRTETEIENENSLKREVAGLYLTYTGNNWSLGLANVYTKLGAQMLKKDELYNQFLFNGREILVSSLDWKWSMNKLFFFGELAHSSSGGIAGISGILTKPVSQLECSMVYRRIDKKYESFFANAFTESAKVNDEQGFYWGIRFLPFSHWSIQAYADVFHHQWITFNTASPSKGAESLVRINFHPNRKTEMYLQYFFEDKGIKSTCNQLDVTTQRKLQRIRMNYNQQLSSKFYLRSRVEFSFWDQEEEHKGGILIYQDFGYKPEGGKLSFNIRVSVFETDNYNTRIYAYENDLLYAYSIVPLFGKGVRSYLSTKLKLNKHLEFWLKGAVNLSYDDEISGFDSNVKQDLELRLQLRYRF